MLARLGIQGFQLTIGRAGKLLVPTGENANYAFRRRRRARRPERAKVNRLAEEGSGTMVTLRTVPLVVPVSKAELVWLALSKITRLATSEESRL